MTKKLLIMILLPLVLLAGVRLVPGDGSDPRALKLYHYGDPDIEITPESDFGFNAASGTITGYTGTNPDVVIPYEIGGVPVVAMGDSAFKLDQHVTKITSPRTLTSIGNGAFYYCTTLTSVYYGGNQPTSGDGIYDGTPTNLVNYVTNPQATGWGATFGGRPVVRLDLYADAFHGSGAALTGVTKPVDLTAQYSAWTTNVVSSGTNIITAAWGNQPRLELNGNAVIDFDFAEATAGNHRLTLSLWSGTNSVSWITNNVDFAETPELSTNAYNTILIRKTGSAKAEGRQL